MMNLQELAKMENWTIKEVCIIIGATMGRALNRKHGKMHELGTNKILTSKTYAELIDNMCNGFLEASSYLYRDTDKNILDLYSRAMLWLEEHKQDDFDKKIEQYLVIGYTLD